MQLLKLMYKEWGSPKIVGLNRASTFFSGSKWFTDEALQNLSGPSRTIWGLPGAHFKKSHAISAMYQYLFLLLNFGYRSPSFVLRTMDIKYYLNKISSVFYSERIVDLLLSGYIQFHKQIAYMLHIITLLFQVSFSIN